MNLLAVSYHSVLGEIDGLSFVLLSGKFCCLSFLQYPPPGKLRLPQLHLKIGQDRSLLIQPGFAEQTCDRTIQMKMPFHLGSMLSVALYSELIPRGSWLFPHIFVLFLLLSLSFEQYIKILDPCSPNNGLQLISPSLPQAVLFQESALASDETLAERRHFYKCQLALE